VLYHAGANGIRTYRTGCCVALSPCPLRLEAAFPARARNAPKVAAKACALLLPRRPCLYGHKAKQVSPKLPFPGFLQIGDV